MAALTWKNVNSPNSKGVLALMSKAGNNYNNALGSVGEAFTGLGDIQADRDQRDIDDANRLFKREGDILQRNLVKQKVASGEYDALNKDEDRKLARELHNLNLAKGNAAIGNSNTQAATSLFSLNEKRDAKKNSGILRQLENDYTDTDGNLNGKDFMAAVNAAGISNTQGFDYIKTLKEGTGQATEDAASAESKVLAQKTARDDVSRMVEEVTGGMLTKDNDAKSELRTLVGQLNEKFDNDSIKVRDALQPYIESTWFSGTHLDIDSYLNSQKNVEDNALRNAPNPRANAANLRKMLNK